MRALIVALASCGHIDAVDCETYDPGRGDYCCNTVEYCQETDGLGEFYRSLNGTVYDCIADDQACDRMLCAVCDISLTDDCKYTRIDGYTEWHDLGCDGFR